MSNLFYNLQIKVPNTGSAWLGPFFAMLMLFKCYSTLHRRRGTCTLDPLPSSSETTLQQVPFLYCVIFGSNLASKVAVSLEKSIQALLKNLRFFSGAKLHAVDRKLDEILRRNDAVSGKWSILVGTRNVTEISSWKIQLERVSGKSHSRGCSRRGAQCCQYGRTVAFSWNSFS